MPIIIKRSHHCLSRSSVSPNALKIMYRLRDKGYKAYLVGGSVRDLLLGRTPKDFDLATDATPSQIKGIFRNCRLVGRRFRLAHLHFSGEIIELATFRKGCDQSDPDGEDEQGDEASDHLQRSDEGMLLRDNLFGTPEEDAWRRDFTVNALIYDIADFSIVDHTGGIDDLNKKLIRSIGNPTERFAEDPVRMIRAIRLSAQLGFTIEKHTWSALVENAHRITLCSPARLFDELQKTLLSGAAKAAWEMLLEGGIANSLLPDFCVYLKSNQQTGIQGALSFFDQSIDARRTVSTPLFLSIFFSSYISERIETISIREHAWQIAAEKAIAEILTEISSSLIVTQRNVTGLREIFLINRRMQKIPGKRAESVAARGYFLDALTHLSFCAESSPQLARTVAWWERLVTTRESRKEPEVVPNKKKRRRRKPNRRAHPTDI